MSWIVILIVVAVVAYLFRRKSTSQKSNLDHLPVQFILFDLETTGLDPEKHEIIEIGAIRVNRDSDKHDTFQSLIKPNKIPKKITEITGITQAIIDSDGELLEPTLREFSEFVGTLRLVSFNADFDMAFLRNAAARHSISFDNPVSCALKMSRRAWPGRKSYRLADLAKDGNLSEEGKHRALGDCQRALIVYTAAASKLGTVS